MSQQPPPPPQQPPPPTAYKPMLPPQPASAPPTSRFHHIELDRQSFQVLLQMNSTNGYHTILKLGAKWCSPCRQIKSHVYDKASGLPASIACYDIDVDASSDMYAFLKSKKMVNGIPVLLFYQRGNLSFVPDYIITGANIPAIDNFFLKCSKHG